MSSRKQKITVSVIGSHAESLEANELAYTLGKTIAELDCILVCGGLAGTMQAACQGCHEAGGTTIGILPGNEKEDANPYVDIALPTTIGFSRNVIVAASADVVVALPGSHGTRSEISYALVYDRPVIDLGQWGIEGMMVVKDVDEACATLKQLVDQIRES